MKFAILATFTSGRIERAADDHQHHHGLRDGHGLTSRLSASFNL